MVDMWEWWRNALGGTAGAINADEPQAGFYESRSKNKTTGEVTRGIVAYWYEPAEFEAKGCAAKLFCKSGFGDAARMVPDLQARERWPYASKRPIAKATYDAVRAGQPWPDENEAAALDRARQFSNDENAAAEADTFEGIKDRLEDLAREADALIRAGAATTQDAADRAADLADRLRKHMDAAAAVQHKWMPLVNRADDCKGRLKRVVVTPYLVAIEAKQQAERVAAIAAGADPEAVAAPKVRAGTTTTVAPRTVTTATVEDWPKALAYFVDNAKVRDLVQQLANAAGRQGICPAGCKINTAKAAA